MQASSAWRVIHVPSFCCFMVPFFCAWRAWNCHCSSVSVAAAFSTRASVVLVGEVRAVASSSPASSSARVLGEHALAPGAEDARPLRQQEREVEHPRALFLGVLERQPLVPVLGAHRRFTFAMKVEIVRAVRSRIVAGEFDDIRGRLEVIAEELADLAIVRLRESIDAGGHELPSTRSA